jgi:hypothetical protein
MTVWFTEKEGLPLSCQTLPSSPDPLWTKVIGYHSIQHDRRTIKTAVRFMSPTVPAILRRRYPTSVTAERWLSL